MKILIDNSEGGISISARDIDTNKARNYTSYFNLNQSTRDKIVSVLEGALKRIKYGAYTNNI